MHEKVLASPFTNRGSLGRKERLEDEFWKSRVGNDQ